MKKALKFKFCTEEVCLKIFFTSSLLDNYNVDLEVDNLSSLFLKKHEN